MRAKNRLFYSGNFGVKQGLPGFLRDLKEVRGEWKISVHGGGAEADVLSKETQGWGEWLRIGPLQEEPAYVGSLLTATACVVTQTPGVGANFLPSKLLPALATGTPVLAICDAHSPLGEEVLSGGFGAVVSPGDKLGLAALLQRWCDDPRLIVDLGQRAQQRAELYTRERSCGAYEDLLIQMTEATRR